jgi:hypothetical protein
MAAWVKYMMGENVLDRDRTVHPLTKKKLNDAELQEALEVSWQRITTDGMIDREITLAGRMGRPALHSQHADHRFLHFKSATSWLAYQKEFGQADVFATMMGHVNTMARDIAHMETFGPNPNLVREYVKAKIRHEASQIDAKEVMAREVERAIDGTKEAIQELRQMRVVTRPSDKNMAKLKLDNLEKEFQALTTGWNRLLIKLDMVPEQTKTEIKSVVDQMIEAQREFSDADYTGRGERLEAIDPTPEQLARDAELREQLQNLMGDMVERIEVGPGASRQAATDYLNGRIKRADAMWELMRGGAPVNARVAQTMAAARNIITSASLGGAIISALSDPSFGQFSRQRFGMALGRSNAVRVLMGTVADMITNAKRDDAIMARLGLDSAMHVMQQTARFGSIDMRHWTGFVADRVLTTTMLQPYTQAGKHLAGFDVMRFLAAQRETPFRDLPDLTQKALKAHGFGELSWDKIRSVTPHAWPLCVVFSKGVPLPVRPQLEYPSD